MYSEKLRNIVDSGKNIVFFGGAGASTESKIPDFRSTDGLYAQSWRYPPETIISHDFFLQNPQEFYRFYREKMLFPDAKPNPAHLALAALERAGKLRAVITQNIDGLHQAAGSKQVFELHGSVHRNACMRCGAKFDLRFILSTQNVPHCPHCGGIIKPCVVLYGEALDDATVEGALSAIAQADTLIVGGTSLAVYPAAGLLRYFHGSTTVVINRSPTPLDRKADLLIDEPIGEVMGQTFQDLIGKA